MRIINRINPSGAGAIYWRTFEPDNTLHIVGEHDGRLKLNESIDLGSKYNEVQFELKWGGLTGTSILAPSSSRKYKTNSTLVLNLHSKVAEIDEEAKKLLILGGWIETSSADQKQGPSILPTEFQKLLNVVMALVDGLAVGYAKTSLALGVSKGTVGLASSILGMFSEHSQPESLGLAEIGDTVKNIIEEHQAKLDAAKITMVCRWFDGYVKKSASQQQSTDPSMDLNPYDKAQFIDELDEHLDGQTDFLGAVANLEHNRDIRKYVIPEYIMGVILHLNLMRLQLVIKQESTMLDVHDINQIIGLSEKYIRTLNECEEDFKQLRASLAEKCPLITDTWEDFTTPKPNGGLVVIAGPTPEGEAYGRGITVKYLSGDRWLTDRTIEQIKGVIEQLQKLNVI